MAVKRKTESTEAKFEKLEEILDKLENKSPGLDETLKLYTEGVEISLELNSKLKEVSSEVLVLSKKLDGAFELNNFEESILSEDFHE